jgi:hypothetical protein
MRPLTMVPYNLATTFFFLEHAGELRIIVLRRVKRALSPMQTHTLKPKLHLLPLQTIWIDPYSPGSYATKKDMPLAPASSHNLLPSSACARQAAKLGAAPSNTHRFLCFQIIQAPKMIRELSPFLTILRASSSILCHQSKKEGSVSCGVRSWRVTFCKNLNQNCLEKTHELNG